MLLGTMPGWQASVIQAGVALADASMAKGKRQKSYESSGNPFNKTRGHWYFEKPLPIKLSRKDQLRKMIQDNKSR